MDKSKKLNFVIMADLSQIGNFSNALYSKIKSVAPVDCVNFEMSDSSCNSRQKVKNCDKIFARTSLTVIYGFVRLCRCDNLCACVHTGPSYLHEGNCLHKTSCSLVKFRVR